MSLLASSQNNHWTKERKRLMKIRLGCLLIVGALAFAGCGDDDPAVDAAVDDPVSFGTLDANGDSYLDVDEIAESADDDRLFDAWDADADSELDPDEIAGNAFKLWDADGNGTVSEKEWRDGTALWYPDGARLAVFSDWDGDGDSELDADEVTERFDVSALGEAWTSGSVGKSTFREAYFDLYDANDDGRVSEPEWRTGSAVWGTTAE